MFDAGFPWILCIKTEVLKMPSLYKFKVLLDMQFAKI